jgi:hypothetical protein
MSAKVLYIAGPGRSGSTILEQILGGVEGWFSCGEVNLLWWDMQCGCGANVFACEFWSPLLEQLHARHPVLGPQQVIELQQRRLGPSPATLAGIARERKRSTPSPLRGYAELLVDLYASAARAAGAKLLIDSSKTAADAYLLATLTDIELYVVHLVRDPRGVAHSWSKRKVKNYRPLYEFGRMGPTKSSLHWLRRNAVIEAVLRRPRRDPFLRVRYEDFVERPQETARSICELVGEPDADLPFVGEKVVGIRPNHTVSGNPVRFGSGERRIEPDEEWRRLMPARARIASTLAAAPMMPRYGYRLGDAVRPAR